ncbi:hypothetical protein [Saliphagus sp. LR7]|nr:hypothetical protein [Saliphagus sp. LR7]
MIVVIPITTVRYDRIGGGHLVRLSKTDPGDAGETKPITSLGQ